MKQTLSDAAAHSDLNETRSLRFDTYLKFQFIR